MATKTVDEWLEYFASPHKARNPALHCYGGEVVRFFDNPNVRGFYLRSGEGEEAVISTRCMAIEKYLAIERVAEYCHRYKRVFAFVGIYTEGVWAPREFVQIERLYIDMPLEQARKEYENPEPGWADRATARINNPLPLVASVANKVSDQRERR